MQTLRREIAPVSHPKNGPLGREFGSGSRLCENSDVELARRNFVSIALNRKRTVLAVAVERGKGRKQFCAFSARACFHTGWVRLGSRATQSRLPLFPQQQTFLSPAVTSETCQQRS